MFVLLNEKYYYCINPVFLWTLKKYQKVKKRLLVKFLKKLKGLKKKKYRKLKLFWWGRRRTWKIRIMHGIIHLKFTSNNTLVTLTGLDGKVIISYSGGNSGFKGSKKSTKYAKESIIEQIGLEATSRGYFRISLHFHGGKMRIRKCVRMLKKLGIKTLMINNLRKIAHNGCRPSKVRRI